MKRGISVECQQRRNFWTNHLRDWEASGLSQVGYCREQGLSIKGFVYWKKRLNPTEGSRFPLWRCREFKRSQ